ncbi:MAG TPA: hypothetical protein VN635_04990 [Conexibacter sp.]|nr:hypothetical protein [Conexibacter sp.]
MRRHLLPLFAVAALPAGLVAGCGGGSVGGSASTNSTGAATAQHAATSSTTAHAGTSRTARARSTPAKSKPSPHAFAAAKITPAAASSLSQRGQLVLPVATGGPGTVRAFGQAEIPGKGIIHIAEAKPVVSHRAGIVDLTLVLSHVARAQLAAKRPIDMFVAVSFSHGEVFEREEVHLRP